MSPLALQASGSRTSLASVARRNTKGLGVVVSTEEVVGVLSGDEGHTIWSSHAGSNIVARRGDAVEGALFVGELPDPAKSLQITRDGRAASFRSDTLTEPLATVLPLGRIEGDCDVLVATGLGHVVRVPSAEIGQRLAGLIKLGESDFVAGAVLVPARSLDFDEEIADDADAASPRFAVMFADGQGGAFVFDADQVRQQSRNSKGPRGLPPGTAFILPLSKRSDVVFVTAHGMALRVESAKIRRFWSRPHRWPSVMKLREGDRVVGVATVPAEE